MIIQSVERIPAASGTPPSASPRAEPRVFYTFRPRTSTDDGDVGEVIEARRREIRRVREGSSEAAELLREIALLQARSGRTREALESYRRGLDSARRAGDHRQSARALESMGMLYARRGEHEAALECYFDALREATHVDDPRVEAAAWMEIAAVYSESGMLDLALESLERSITRLERPSESYMQARARLSAASVLTGLLRPHEAAEQALRALVALEAFDDYTGQVDALLVLGRAYRQLGDHVTAGGTIERAASLARARAHAAGLAGALLALAELRRDEGRSAQSVELLDEGLIVARDAGLVELEWRLHELAADVYETAADTARALAHCRAFIESRERSFARIRSVRFDTLRALHEAQALARERDDLRRELEMARNELVEKSRELTAATLSLVQKSELLDEVRRQLGALVGAADDYSEAIVQPIIEGIAERGAPEESWRIFEQQFDAVHRDYLHRLAERHPELTPMEMKICTLTRIDLSAKEIARLLNVSERNVQNHRYRIRRKLGLRQEENLASMLSAI